jgi:hypothetical protein
LLPTLDTHQEQQEDTSSATPEPYDSSLTADTFQTSVSPAEECLILIKLSVVQSATQHNGPKHLRGDNKFLVVVQKKTTKAQLFIPKKLILGESTVGHIYISNAVYPFH